MMNKKLVTAYIVVILLVFTGFLYSYATSTEPGTASDPLVTKSYVDTLIDEIETRISIVEDKMDNFGVAFDDLDDESEAELLLSGEFDEETINQYIDAKVAELLESNTTSSSNDSFEVIKVLEGQRLIAGASTEIIVRSGIASVVGNESGQGIADITMGQDITDTTIAELNHLLIVPRADERGLLFKTDSYIMIKGDYTIK